MFGKIGGKGWKEYLLVPVNMEGVFLTYIVRFVQEVTMAMVLWTLIYNFNLSIYPKAKYSAVEAAYTGSKLKI